MPKDVASILVVDDDPITLELLATHLEEASFRVSTASDLATLRRKIQERSFDFVLLDLFLGEESGLVALPFLVREVPYTKIIIMSANGTVQLAVDAMERGASSFVAKSKDPKELVQLIQEKYLSAKAEPLADTPAPEDLGIIGQSVSVREVVARIHQIKDIDSTVLITGESGTGKELVARAIHRSSIRATKRFEAINCGAIPENLLESELFGHRRGAFTDAKVDRKGLFEICHGGTLFLDEIGELPISLQVKILRVLQEKEVMPLGASQSIPIDTRVVCATNRDLAEEIKRGAFRTDLFYRLNVLRLHLAPLRDRRDDIPLLISFFLRKFNQRFTRTVQTPSKELETRLQSYDWPGNIRELQNAIERGVVLSQDGQLHLEDMLDFKSSLPSEEPAVADAHGLGRGEIWNSPLSEAKKQFEKAYLQHLLEVTNGNVSEVARISGRYRTDIYRLMSKYGMESEEFRS